MPSLLTIETLKEKIRRFPAKLLNQFGSFLQERPLVKFDYETA